MNGRLHALKKRFARELDVHRRVPGYLGTPGSAGLLLGLAVGYALLPLDVMPDWIPLLGRLDDLVLVPMLVWLAMRRIPASVVEERREGRF